MSIILITFSKNNVTSKITPLIVGVYILDLFEGDCIASKYVCIYIEKEILLIQNIFFSFWIEIFFEKFWKYISIPFKRNIMYFWMSNEFA